jgi:predicted nucleotidyltransferase
LKHGLTESVIKKIHSVLEKYPQVEEAVIYGSRAKGNFKKGSDIDLTLQGDNLEMQVLLRILNDLDNLYLPYNIDLSIYSNIKDPDVLAHIERVGKQFYHREKNSGLNNNSSTLDYQSKKAVHNSGAGGKL